MKFLDFIMPPRCGLCDERVLDAQSLCAGCASQLSYLTDPLCQICGKGFDVPMPKGSQCGACMQDMPPYASARSAVLYDGVGRELTLSLKHAKNYVVAPVMGRLMVQAWRSNDKEWERDKDAMVVVSVPLHPIRLFLRRFNQSAILAAYFADGLGVSFLPNSLRRRKNTPTQGGLGRQARARNVKHAFFIPKAERSKIAGQAVILIDDVFTTGATVHACAKNLLKAGAREVHVVTFARVVSNWQPNA